MNIHNKGGVFANQYNKYMDIFAYVKQMCTPKWLGTESDRFLWAYILTASFIQ